MSDMIDFEKKIKKPLFIFIVVMFAIMYFCAPSPVKAGVVTKQNMFVNKAGEVILLTKSIGATETVAKMEGDMVAWLITSGYSLLTPFPNSVAKDVQCTLNVDWEMGVVRINCDRVVRNKSSSAEYVTAHDSETTFFFNLNIYKKHPALFYSAIQDSIVNLRSDLRKNSVKEKMK